MSRPSASSRDNRSGSRKPSEALVGVTSQPPSSSLTLMLPDEPGVSPRSNSERPNRQMPSRILVSGIAIPLGNPLGRFPLAIPLLRLLWRYSFLALSHALAARPSRD